MLKKLLRQSSQYLLGNIAIKLIGFVSLPILTHLLPVEEYGLLSLVGASLFILIAIVKLGLQHAGVRFYSFYNDSSEKLATFYSTLYWGSLAMSGLIVGFLVFVCLILGTVFGGVFNNWLIFVVAGLVVIDVMILRIMNFMQVEQRVTYFNLISISQHYGNVALGIVFLVFVSKTTNWYYLGSLISSFTILVICTTLLLSKGKINPRNFSFSFFKECLHFGMPLQLMEVGNLLIKFSDKYLIQIIVGISAVGIYAVGASLSMYAQELIFMPISFAVFPLLMEMFKKEGLTATQDFISTVSKYLWLVSIPMIFGFSMLGKEIVVILASEKFIDTVEIIPFMITGTILWGFCKLYAAGLHISKKTKTFAAVVFSAAIFNIILNILLIPRLSYKGAAIATLASFLLLLILVMKVSFVHLRIKIYPGKIAKAVLCSVFMYIILIPIQINIPILQLVLKIFVGFVVYVISMIAIDSDIRNITIRFFRLSFLPASALINHRVYGKRVWRIFNTKKLDDGPNY